MPKKTLKDTADADDVDTVGPQSVRADVVPEKQRWKSEVFRVARQ